MNYFKFTTKQRKQSYAFAEGCIREFSGNISSIEVVQKLPVQTCFGAGSFCDSFYWLEISRKFS